MSLAERSNHLSTQNQKGRLAALKYAIRTDYLVVFGTHMIMFNPRGENALVNLSRLNEVV